MNVSPVGGCSGSSGSAPTRRRGRGCTSCVGRWCAPSGTSSPRVVELDETMIGGVAHGAGGGYGDKAAVMIAVERNEIRRLGRVRMAVAQRPGTSELVEWATQVIEPGSTIRTDGARMFSRLTELGYTHLATPSSKGVHKVENPDTVMAGPHMVSSLLKRCTAGTLHYRLSYQHMPYYLDEFTFRFNRRNSRARGMLFYRLLQQAVDTDPHPLKDLIGG